MAESRSSSDEGEERKLRAMSRERVTFPRRFKGEALEKKKLMNLQRMFQEKMAKPDPWMLPTALGHGDGLALGVRNKKDDYEDRSF